MAKNYINFLQFVLFFIILSFLPTNLKAQCAGTNGSKIICDIADPVNQNISLFSLLGGTPIAGGTWSDNNGSRGLSTSTGILNAQLIRRGGTYNYTYTPPENSGCTDKATVTITIGAFSGNPAPYATKCSDEGSFNLFSAFNSTVISPHNNGIWTNSAGQTVSSTIPITDMQGTYQFTYTVPPVLACSPSSMSSTIVLTVFKAPNPGVGRNIALCGTTDLDAYTNFDLTTLLSGQENGGRWSGIGVTSPTNPVINLKQIYDNNGPGEYNYLYTVLSSDATCPDKAASIIITLEQQLDFTGAKIVIASDICEDAIATAGYAAVLTQGTQPIPNGQYTVTFSVSGPNGGTETLNTNFVNGIAIFPVNSSYFKQVGTFTVTVNNIFATASKGACENIINNLADDLHIYTLPYLEGTVLTPEPTCQNKDALIQLSNATRLADGNYDIVYNVTGDNFALGQMANITVAGGSSSFIIPGNLNANSGASVITITNITNTVTGCTNTANIRGNLIINPLPNASTLAVSVNDNCLNAQFTASVSGLGNLTNVTLSYSLLGNNPSTLQTVILPVSGGKADFVIPADLLLNTGSTIFSAVNLKNNITNCDVNLNNILDSFIINPIPAAPTVSPQDFCKVDEATISNLSPNGTQYTWYNSATSTTPLAVTQLLETAVYYVKETSPAGCISDAAAVSITINDSPAPVLNSDGADFCGLTNPTIADLSNRTNVPSTVVWYDAETNGNLLSSSTPLTEQGRYYGFNYPASDCFSSEFIAVTTTLTDCDDVPNDFFIPDGFSPNGDGVNDSFVIKDIEFLYPDYTLEIFNRYGNGMYKGDKNKPAWNGMNYEKSGIAGGIAPNGVYFYVLHFNKDSKKPKQGRLYLNR